MMHTLTPVGFRVGSGAQKLQSFNVATGGPVMALMAPKMDTFLGHIKDLTGVAIPLEKVRTALLTLLSEDASRTRYRGRYK